MEQETNNLTFKEKLEGILLGRLFLNKNSRNNLIVFDIENENKRHDFLNSLSKTEWKKFDSEIHDYDDDFDYVYFYGSHFDTKGLYEIFENFNGKILIFDNDSVIKKQSLLNLIEGAVCSSPNSGDKWPIRLDGKKEFIFKGSVILLTSIDCNEFAKIKKFDYLKRDMMKL